jgi:hypothetical protein
MVYFPCVPKQCTTAQILDTKATYEIDKIEIHRSRLAFPSTIQQEANLDLVCGFVFEG